MKSSLIKITKTAVAPRTQAMWVVRGLLLTPLLFVCFGLAPMAQAVGPDTGGAIPGSNNGEGIGVLVSRIGGVWNTGTGFEALNQLTAGNQNTASGFRALFSDINGGFNTATGVYSLFSNTSGFYNSATGAYSLANNISGNYNTATGYAALYRNTADANTATGFGALNRNTAGNANTATGVGALEGNNAAGSYNNAFGRYALLSHTSGDGNTAVGESALLNETTGTENTAVGNRTLVNSITGDFNIALGAEAGGSVTTVSNVICIGHGISGANVNNSCFIGNIYSNVQPVVGTDPDYVTITSSNRLGRGNISSRRYKHDIKPMDKASEVLFALNPVSFRYNKQYDATQTIAFGLIAEEVAEVSPALVGRNDKGQPESVRYEQINAMLLNEFLKEHRKVEAEEATITQLKEDFQSKLAEQQKQIKALTSGLEKVNNQVELNKPAPQMVGNNQ